jgi:putative inorganic carbon (HCO3(-)) transporter
MRALLLLAVVSVLCAAAVVRPRAGLYSYIWFGLMRPDALAWCEGRYPLSMALAIATLAGSLRFLPEIAGRFLNPIVLLLVLLQIPIVLSAVFALNPSLCYEPLQLFIHVVAMALLIPLLVQTAKQLRDLLLVMACTLGALGTKFGLYGIAHGGVRLVSGHAGFLGDNNDLALGLVMATPLCWYGRSLVSAAWARAALLAMTFATLAAVVMTHSRGAAVSLAVVFLLIAFHSRRKIAVLCLLLLLTAPAVYLVRQTYIARLSTLEAPEQEQSASLRLLYAKGALAMWRDHPLLGVGFGAGNQMALWSKYMSDAVIATPQVIHNTYLQMLVDSGTIALVLYLVLLMGTAFWLQKSAVRTLRRSPGLEIYPIAIQASLVAFIVGCTFLSRIQFDLAYIVLMCAAAWYAIERKLPEPA